METAYEAMYIVDPNLPAEQIDATVAKYTDVITRTGGIVDDTDRWDPRRLAYEIKGHREGLYILVNFRGEPAVRNELHRIFGISDDIIRANIFKQDKRADRFPSQTRTAEQERREREQAARQAANPQYAERMEQQQTITNLAAQGVTESDADTPLTAAMLDEDVPLTVAMMDGDDTPVGDAAASDNTTAPVPTVEETAEGANEPAPVE